MGELPSSLAVQQHVLRIQLAMHAMTGERVIADARMTPAASALSAEFGALTFVPPIGDQLQAFRVTIGAQPESAQAFAAQRAGERRHAVATGPEHTDTDARRVPLEAEGIVSKAHRQHAIMRIRLRRRREQRDVEIRLHMEDIIYLSIAVQLYPSSTPEAYVEAGLALTSGDSTARREGCGCTTGCQDNARCRCAKSGFECSTDCECHCSKWAPNNEDERLPSCKNRVLLDERAENH